MRSSAGRTEEEELRLLAERHDQHVAIGGLGRVLGLDRRHAVVAAGVVDQRTVERVGQGEAAERALVEVVDRGGAAAMLRRSTSSTST